MPKPKSAGRKLIAVVDWRPAPASLNDITVEQAIIGNAARLKYFLADDANNFTPEILGAHIIIVWHNTSIPAAGIAKMKQCRAIIRNGVGFDTVDVAAAAARGIAVCNVPDYGTEEVADHAIALTLALTRQLFPLDAEAKKLGWKIHGMKQLRRTRTRTFGVVGLGRIGTAAALRAKALGFRVVFYDPHLPNGVHKAVGIERAASLPELLKQCDVLSIHCPLSAATHHLISEKELALLKPTAYVVNTARGAIIKKSAILHALREGRIAGAGLDVIEDEPLRTAEEAATPNLIATCHAAFCSVDGMIEMRTTSARIARAGALGQPLENVVNGVDPR